MYNSSFIHLPIQLQLTINTYVVFHFYDQKTRSLVANLLFLHVRRTLHFYTDYYRHIAAAPPPNDLYFFGSKPRGLQPTMSGTFLSEIIES